MNLISIPPRTLLVMLSMCLLAATAGKGQFWQRVDLVSIDALVATDRGEAVTTLQASDFEVLVDGTPRRIVAFRRVGPGHGSTVNDTTGPAGGQAAAPAPERVVVLLVQRDQIRPHEGRSFLEAGAAFIDTLDAADHVSVRTIPAESPELRMLRNHELLKKRLHEIRGTAPPPHPMFTITPDEAASIVFFRDEAALDEVTSRECSRFTNRGPACRMEVETQAEQRYHEMRVRALETLKELDHLIKLLSAFDGPKHLVFITTGPPQTPDIADAVQQIAAAAARARVHIHALQIPLWYDLISADGPGRQAPPVRQTNTAGYSLAGMTGGMALTPSDPRVAFRRLAAELDGAYELGIEASAADRDGKPHRIEVRVPSRDDLSIRARQQFTLFPLPARKSAEPPEPAPLPKFEEVAPPPPGDPVPAALLQRLGDYIVRFEKEFSSAVAEERYVQLIRPLRGTPSWPSDERALEWYDGNWTDYPRTGPIAERRQLLSDVLLVHTPQGWLGYRDVAEVNGRAVRDRRERVSRLFLSKDADRDDQLRRIAAESARYNLGGFARTLNIPTLPLFFLRAQNHGRFTFTSAGRESLDGVTTDVIRYEEHQRPTLIGDRAGEDVPVSGRIWMDSATGQVVQTEIHVLPGERARTRRGTLLTRYRRDSRFDVLIPDYMWEWYDSSRAYVIGSVSTYTIVEGLARYGNYRRFGVVTGQDIR